MDKLKNEISNIIKHTPEINLAALCHQLNSYSAHEVLTQLKQLSQTEEFSNQHWLFLSDANAILEQIHQLDANELIEELCNRASVLQTSGFISRYNQLSDCHRHICPQTDVVMFGDSITDWAPWQDLFPTIRIANRGIAGDTTTGMFNRIDTTLLPKPNKLFFMAGINDLAQGYSVETVLDNFQKMLIVWAQQPINIYIQSTLYVGPRLLHLNNKVEELNLGLQALCLQYNAQFVDINAVLCPEKFLLREFSCDDLHLNAKAYQLWGKHIAPLLF